MATVRDLHHEAMAKAEEAMLLQRQDHQHDKVLAFQAAYRLEWRAAMRVGDSEPSRSVLYRSAGWLAHNAGRFRLALHLADKGLQGQPPTDIRWELEDLKASAADYLFFSILDGGK